MAFAITFIKNLRLKQRGKLELDNINDARNYLFRKSQAKSFRDAIKDIKRHRYLSKKDRLLCLSPFFESEVLCKKLGRVTRNFTGPSYIARSCEVKTALGKLTRPAVKLMHVYPKITTMLGLGFVGPEDVNARD